MSLDHSSIDSLSGASLLAKHCPVLTDLDLSHNKLTSWSEVSCCTVTLRCLYRKIRSIHPLPCTLHSFQIGGWAFSRNSYRKCRVYTHVVHLSVHILRDAAQTIVYTSMVQTAVGHAHHYKSHLCKTLMLKRGLAFSPGWAYTPNVMVLQVSMCSNEGGALLLFLRIFFGG